MLVAAFGPPCIYTNAGFRIVRAILDTLVPDCEHILANSVEELTAAWSGNPDRSIGFTCNAPDERMSEFFLESRAPLLLFWSDGPEIVADHLKFGTDFGNSIRFTSKYLATLEPIRRAPTSTTFLWPDPGTDLSDLALSIADAAGLSVNANELADIMGRLVSGYTPGRPFSFDALAGSRTGLEAIVSDKAPHALPLLPDLGRIFGYDRAGGDPWVAPLVWPSMLLSTCGAQNNTGTSVIDVAGPARLLADGPYLHIPRGRWVARVDLRIQGNETNNSFAFDVDCGEAAGGGPARLPPAGRFSCEIPFTVKTTILSVSLRLILQEGAIDSSIELLCIGVSRIEGGNGNR